MTTISNLQHPKELGAHTHAIELFVVPQAIMTLTMILPGQIESRSGVEKRTLTSESDRAAFFKALEASKPAPGRQASEFRIKAVLLDASGARIAELYASAITAFGMLGDEQFLTYGNRDFVTFVLDAVKPSHV